MLGCSVTKLEKAADANYDNKERIKATLSFKDGPDKEEFYDTVLYAIGRCCAVL